MALATHVTNRVTTQRLAQLTSDTGTTIDTAVLGYAVDDAIADIEMEGAVAYDDDDAVHRMMGVQGVVLYLLTYKVEVNAFERLEKWQDRLHNKLRLQGQANRVMPKSTSELTPTDEAASGEIVRPRLETRGAYGDGLIPNQGRDRGRRSRRGGRGV